MDTGVFVMQAERVEVSVSTADSKQDWVLEVGEHTVASHPEPVPDDWTDMANPAGRLIDQGT